MKSRQFFLQSVSTVKPKYYYSFLFSKFSHTISCINTHFKVFEMARFFRSKTLQNFTKTFFVEFVNKILNSCCTWFWILYLDGSFYRWVGHFSNLTVFLLSLVFLLVSVLPISPIFYTIHYDITYTIRLLNNFFLRFNHNILVRSKKPTNYL